MTSLTEKPAPLPRSMAAVPLAVRSWPILSVLAPILSFLMYEEDQWFDPPNLVAHRETAGKLADAVVGLYRWRLAGSDS